MQCSHLSFCYEKSPTIRNEVRLEFGMIQIDRHQHVQQPLHHPSVNAETLSTHRMDYGWICVSAVIRSVGQIVRTRAHMHIRIETHTQLHTYIHTYLLTYIHTCKYKIQNYTYIHRYTYKIQNDSPKGFLCHNH